jgi:hypothetical protein
MRMALQLGKESLGDLGLAVLWGALCSLGMVPASWAVTGHQGGFLSGHPRPSIQIVHSESGQGQKCSHGSGDLG